MKSNRVSMKGIMIRGKVDDKIEGVSSLDKPKYVQGKLYEIVIGDDNIVSIDKNYVVANKIDVRIVVSDESNNFDDTIEAFNDYDNPPSENVIDVILINEVPTTETD